MKQEEQISKVRTKAHEYFANGYHCAEAVVAAVLEERNEKSQEAIRHATAFGGGVGRTFGETCGALSGAMITIGHLHGRKSQGENWDLPAHLGAHIRGQFLKEYQTTLCRNLRERFGETQQSELCKQLTGEVAAHVFRLLADNTEDKDKTADDCPYETVKP